MQFNVVRLGKDSIPAIKRLSSSDLASQLPFKFEFSCKQVEDGIGVGDYVHLWLGSDNSNGQPTAWKQGLRAIGRISSLDKGSSFNANSDFKIEVVAVFSNSIDQIDLLEKSASHYRYFSQYPVVGFRSFRNNAIQKVNEGNRQRSTALLTAISILAPETKDQLKQNAPDLLPLLSFVPVGQVENASSVKETISSNDVVWDWISNQIFKKGERNFLFLGAPGTGKTWYAHEIAKKLTEDRNGRRTFVQFHPSYSYDDFVEGYTPKLNSTTSAVEYTVQEKHFLRLCTAARADGSNLYVMVIDELTRGDPSRVFGELLTYIECSHRNKEFHSAYSDQSTFIPENVVIIATANPFDRSVGELDDALIRRFAMRDFPPDAQLLEQRLKSNGAEAAFIRRLLHAFKILNEQLPHGFGHSHLWDVRNPDDFDELWKSRISFLIRRTLQFDDEALLSLIGEIDVIFPPQAAVASTDDENADAQADPSTDGEEV